MAHKLLTDIEVQGEGLFNGNLTLGTPSAFSKLVFDTSGYDIGEIEVGSYQAMSIDAQDGVFELMSDTSSQNHTITGTMGGYVTLNFSGDKKLQTGSTGINITGLLSVSGDARVVGAFRDTGNSPGTSGQVLSSTVTGTSWITPSSGNVSGTGTTNNMTKWSNTTGGLADALMTDNGSTVTLSTNGSANTFNLYHTSGSGVALNIEKGGNNEGLIVNKTSGSGNAVSITGGSYFNGSVGIGTASPSVALEVSGEIDAAGGDGYRIDSKPFANWGTDLLTLGDWDGEGYETRFMGSNSSEVMRVTGTSVGIGTTSTSAKLDVYDSGTAINARSAQSVGLKVQGGANGMDIAQFKNQMGTITNVIDTSGFFGIGETDPDTPLHIKSISVPKIKLETTQTSYATPGQIEAWNGASNTLHGYLTWGTNPGVTGCRLAFSNAGNTSWLEVGSNYVRNTIAGSVKSHINATGLGINNTNPQEDLDVTGTIKGDEYKGYLPAFQHGGFYHSSSSSSNTIYWIPTNYISETTSSQYYNNWVAPYSGRVRKIVMRYASGTTPTATSVAFKKSINGAGDLSTYTATITNAASTSMTAKRDFSPTDITFNEGDRVRIGFTTNGGTRLLYGFAYTIVFEYNKD